MERFTGPQEEQIFVEDEQIIKQFRFCSFILKKGYYLVVIMTCWPELWHDSSPVCWCAQ